MKAGDLLQQVVPRTRARALARGWPKRRSAAPRSRTRWLSRTDDGIRIEPLAPRAQDASPIARAQSAVAVDRHAAHRRSRSRTAPTGRRWTTSTRARPASRWSSRARRTRSATGCPPTPESLEIALRQRAAQPRAHPRSTRTRQAAPWSTGWWRCSASGAPIRPSSAFRSASIRRRSLPATAGCACRSRRCKPRCRNRWRISSRSACRASCSRRRPRLSQCRRDRGAGARHRDAGRSPSRICACSRRRARRWSTPRRISASRSASIRTSSCRSPSSGRCGCCGTRAGSRARSRRPRGSIHAETSYRMMTALDPGNQHPAHHDRRLRGGRRRRGFDLDPAAHHRAWPAGRLRAAHRAQHAADPGRRKPFDFVADPVAGSGSVEALTDALCESGMGRVPADRERRRPAAQSRRRPHPDPGRRGPRPPLGRVQAGKRLSSARPCIRRGSNRRSRRCPPRAARCRRGNRVLRAAAVGTHRSAIGPHDP